MTSTTNVCHLYRSLLRECTYLPVPRARSYIKSYVNASFRQHIPRHSKHIIRKGTSSRDKSSKWNSQKEHPEPKQAQLLARGRKFLSILHRANEGYLKPLEKILKMTYGRTGKRRRQLMADFMAPESKEDQTSAALEDSLFPPLSQSVPNPDAEASPVPKTKTTPLIPKIYYPGWQPPFIVRSLLRSQSVEQQFLEFQRGKIQTKPSLPEKTIWFKPLPTCRAKNLMRKWYAKQTASLMPPLPHKEWEEIKALATNTPGRPSTTSRRRRKPAQLPEPENCTEAESLPSILLHGAPKSPTFERYRFGRPHKMTNRFLRRRMVKILRHVPVIEAVPSSDLENVRDAVEGGDNGDRYEGKDVTKKTVTSKTGRDGKAEESIVFRWEQADRRRFGAVIPTKAQAAALFGEWQST